MPGRLLSLAGVEAESVERLAECLYEELCRIGEVRTSPLRRGLGIAIIWRPATQMEGYLTEAFPGVPRAIAVEGSVAMRELTLLCARCGSIAATGMQRFHGCPKVVDTYDVGDDLRGLTKSVASAITPRRSPDLGLVAALKSALMRSKTGDDANVAWSVFGAARRPFSPEYWFSCITWNDPDTVFSLDQSSGEHGPGFVYVLLDTATGDVKIGKAVDAVERLREANTYNLHLRVVSIFFSLDCTAAEKVAQALMLQLFGYHRLRHAYSWGETATPPAPSEWFRADTDHAVLCSRRACELVTENILRRRDYWARSSGWSPRSLSSDEGHPPPAAASVAAAAAPLADREAAAYAFIKAREIVAQRVAGVVVAADGGAQLTQPWRARLATSAAGKAAARELLASDVSPWPPLGLGGLRGSGGSGAVVAGAGAGAAAAAGGAGSAAGDGGGGDGSA